MIFRHSSKHLSGLYLDALNVEPRSVYTIF